MKSRVREYVHKAAKLPVNLDKLRSFWWLACYYKHLVPDYSTHAALLNTLTHKEVPFLWGKRQQERFDRLKNALASYPYIRIIKCHWLLVVDTDACNMAIGTVLHQVQEGVERVLGYYSKTLNSAQRNYCTTKKELLAIVAMFNQWDVYMSCVSEPFVLRTDHAALTWLKTMRCRDKAMLRWCDAVNKYNFVIQHRSGVNHQNADAMSRMRLTKCG